MRTVCDVLGPQLSFGETSWSVWRVSSLRVRKRKDYCTLDLLVESCFKESSLTDEACHTYKIGKSVVNIRCVTVVPNKRPFDVYS